jgi:hypothetical protein
VGSLDELRDRSKAAPADMASQFATIGGLALLFPGVAVALLAIVALAASIVPAWRATRIEPTAALQDRVVSAPNAEPSAPIDDNAAPRAS